MASIVLFGIVLLVAGGAIAFLGDWLGSYVGKKRLSVFGLRPRHTAMVYTIVSGSLIAILTFSAVLFCDREASQALTQWRDTVVKNRALTLRNRALETQYTASLLKTQVAEGQRDAADQKRIAAQVRQAAAERGLARAQVQLASKETAVTASKLALQVSQRHLVAVENDVHAKKADLVVARQAVDAAAEHLAATQSQLSVAMVKVADARQENARLVVEQDRLTNDNKVLVTKNKDLAAHSVSLYTLGNVIYQKGDELDRTVIATAQPVADVRQTLDEWLKTISRIADKRGAGSGANGREVRVVSPTDADANEDDLLDSLAYNISRQHGIVSSVVVLARVDAGKNVLVGEQVKLNLQPYDNLLVYPKGAAVATTAIDGTLANDQIEAKLRDFLVQTVRPIAVDKDIMPTIDPVSRERSYGEIVDDNGRPVDGWSAIDEAVRVAGTGAQVTAVTADDVYTSGPLRLHLTVNKPEGAAALGDPFQTGSDGTRLPLGTTASSTVSATSAIDTAGPSLDAHGGSEKPNQATGTAQATIAAPATLKYRKAGVPNATQ